MKATKKRILAALRYGAVLHDMTDEYQRLYESAEAHAETASRALDNALEDPSRASAWQKVANGHFDLLCVGLRELCSKA